jgi:signal peptide peptidase SppA
MTIDELWAGTEASLAAYQKVLEQRTTLEARAYGEEEEEESSYLLDIQGNVGVISIKGPLTHEDESWFKYAGIASYNEIRRALIEAASDPAVHSILLDIDSGGGATNGVLDASSLIRLVNDKVKPVTAFSGGSMLSAAYWLGMSAGRVYAGEIATLGSIGIIATHMERSKMLKDNGIGVTVLRAGKYKALANPFEPLSEEGKASLQKALDATYNVFINNVATMRGHTVQYVDENMAQGRQFIGEAAVGVGLVDGITSYDELISQLQAQALDMNNKNKHYHVQQEPSTKGAFVMGKKAFTEQQLAAIALGATLNAEAQGAEGAEPTTEAKTPDPAAESKAPAETEAKAETDTKVDAGTEPKSSVEQASDASIVTYLQGQVAEKDRALLEANVELAKLRDEHAAFSAVVTPLSEVVAASVGHLAVALGGTAPDVTGMAPVALLAEHKRLSDQFTSKFKVGGVAGVDAANAAAEIPRIDPLQRIRLAAVRSTTPASQQ